MRAASLDRRVRKEATLLVREARAALLVKPSLRGKGGDLAAATDDVENSLRAGDLKRVRHNLPLLDSLVDELIKRPPKSTTRDTIESVGTAILIALALRAFVVEAFKIPSSSMYPTLEIGDHIFVNKFLYGVRIPWTRTKLFELRGPKRGEVIVFIYPCDPERDYIKRVIALAGDSVEVRCNVVYVNGVAVPSKMIDSACRYYDHKEATDKWQWEACSRYRETVNGVDYDTFHDPERPARDARNAAGTLALADSHDFPTRFSPFPPTCSQSPEAMKAANIEQVLGKIVETKSEATANACEPQMHYVVPPGHVFVMGDNRSNSNDARYWGSVPITNIKGKAMFIWLSYEHWGLTDWTGIRWDRIGNFVHN